MSNIDKIDKNFAVSTVIEDGKKSYNASEKPFEIYGLIKPSSEGEIYRRLPENIAKTVSEGVHLLSTNTAGGRVRFKTNSRYIGIIAQMPEVGKMPHFAFTGSIGFDLYADVGGKERYIHSFIPTVDIENLLTSGYDTEQNEMREYTINFPLYSSVEKLYIILDNDARVLPARKYKIEVPVVYYGSSITQGGCASRPGNSYEAMISRSFDCNYINLGFSGNAKGEKEIADYIASLDMSVFVYDYDYNAPSAEHLRDTHSKMFNIIRKSHPNLPIVIMSRPWYGIKAWVKTRYNIVYDTYKQAKNNGDESVYFVDVIKEIEESGVCDSFSVDGCHPNDLGFFCMANALEKTLRKIF